MTTDYWAGPYTVANELADGKVQVVNVLGQPFCFTTREGMEPDWSGATGRAQHIARLLNLQQPEGPRHYETDTLR